jgi:hypothetical protein
MEIRDLLYKAISEYGEKRILSDIAQGESSTTISAIFEKCIPTLEKTGENNSKSLGSLAEGLIHYLLTVALIPSQRKTTVHAVDIDVAVPDTKTLSSSPNNVIIISFPKTKEPSVIIEHVNKLKKIQPKSENIWVVIDEPVSVEGKLYTLDKDEFTFSNIVNDLISFTSNTKQSKLKIFRI